MGKKFQTAGNTITGIGKKLTPLSAAAAGVFVASMKSASDFTNGMAKMSTLFDTTQVNVGDLSKEFLQLSNDTGKSAGELAEAGYQALSAGVDVKGAGGFVKTAANLAKVGFSDTTTAVDVLTTAINAYGMESDDANGIANKLVRTQNLGKTTVGELASSMGKIIPTASSMGVSLDNLCAVYTLMTKQGISTAESTTYANSMLNELGKSGSTVGTILQEQTGHSFQELMGSGMSLGDVLGILQTYAADTGTNFNELWGSSEAGKAAIALLNGGVDEFNGTLSTMGDNTDLVAEGLEKLQTPSETVHMALNRIKNAGIELGSAFLTALTPAINAVADKVQQATQWFGGLSDSQKTAIAAVVAFVAALAPVVIGVGKVISVVGSVITAFGSLGTALGAILNPVGLVVTAVAALTAGVVYLWNTNEDFRNAVTRIWEGIKTVVSGACDAIVGFVTGIVWNLPEIGTKALDTAKGLVETFKSTVKGLVDKIGWVLPEIKSTVLNTTQKAVESFTKTAKGLVDKLGWILPEIKSQVLNTTQKAVETFTKTAKGLVDKIGWVLPTIQALVLGTTETLVTTAKNKWKSLVDKMGWKLPSIKSTVLDTANTAISKAVKGFQKLMGFSWHLPKLALPHVSISGSFSINPPSVPHFSISWYKKAMDQPYMFTKPTLFDVNPLTGTAKGAGEAGDEVMIGKDTMLNMIRTAVAQENAALADKFESLTGMVAQFFPEVLTMMNRAVVLDSGALVGELAPEMDEALGAMLRKKER